jgi:hypothetical protein
MSEVMGSMATTMPASLPPFVHWSSRFQRVGQWAGEPPRVVRSDAGRTALQPLLCVALESAKPYVRLKMTSL